MLYNFACAALVLIAAVLVIETPKWIARAIAQKRRLDAGLAWW